MLSRLAAIPGLKVSENVPLSQCTRFALGGPASLLIDVASEEALAQALQLIQRAGGSLTLIGGGSNLVASDAGFPGAVLRYAADRITIKGSLVHVEAGAVLQDLVNQSIDAGRRGMETLTGIPGWLGGAIYGNAGAYGHSIHERVESVRFFDGRDFREAHNEDCRFHYRESIFKRHKDWIIVSAQLQLDPGDASELRDISDGILKIRNEKYPPSLRCAGSIFKNLILAELSPFLKAHVPETVVREGKVPSAYFLEQVGAKGMCLGGIRVADYHANLIFNSGEGTAAEVHAIVDHLKGRVRDRFGLDLEEEVQYVGEF